MGAVLGSLVDSGYGVAYRVLDSQFFGLAQRRKRVFIVGHLGGVRRAGAVLFDGESMSRDSPPSRETLENATYETSPSLRASGVSSERVGDTRGQDCVVAQTLKADTGRLHIESDYVVATAFRTSGNCGATEQGDKTAALNRATDPTQNIVAMTLNAKNGKRYDAESEMFATGADCYNGSITGDVSATLGTPGSSVSASGPTLIQRQGVRRLMPIECERLQGFPDNWTAGFSDSARYRMLGNAVSVPVIEWIGRRIVECHLQQEQHHGRTERSEPVA